MSGFLCSMVGATFSVAAAAEVLRQKKGVYAINQAKISTAQSKFGGSSALFDGTTDALVAAPRTDFNLTHTQNFTLECWIRPTNVSIAQAIISKHDPNNSPYAGFSLEMTSAGKVQFYDGVSFKEFNSALTANTWYHIAIVSTAGAVKMYQNGTQQTTTFSLTSSFFDNYNELTIGCSPPGNGGSGSLNRSFNGYIDEVRISNSTRYTSNFTAPTAPFNNDANTLLLVHCDGTNNTTYFEDDNGVRASQSLIAVNQTQLSTAQSQFGSSSIVFDGNDDYITVTGMSSLTGDYTLECWARFDILPWLQTLNGGAYMMLVTTGSNDYVTIFRNGAGSQVQIQIATAGKYGSFTKSGVNLAINTWYHIAVVRNSGVFKVFFNGTELTTFINDSGFTNSGRTENMAFGTIGRFIDSRGSWDGYIDELRVSNSARYTGDFIPPTAPFVNDANTVLLIHAEGTNASTVLRDDNGAIPAAITTSSAVAFDGTGDYYEATSLSNSAAADSKYALIAFTFYWNGGSILQHPVNLRLGTGSGDYGFWIWINGGRSQLKFVTGTGSNPGSIYENTENSINTNAWNQVVMWIDTTSSTTSQIWVNGNQKAYSNDGFPTGSLFNWTNTASTLKIGQKNTSQTGTGNDFDGRISQVYISAASSFPGIDKFWRQGKPQDLGADGRATGLAQPLIYHYGDASTFPTNRGTGFGSYTLTANGNVATSSNNSIYQVLRTQKGVIAVGNAQIDNAQSKFGGTSAYFDGTGDYLTINSDSLKYLSGDFTVECWARWVSVTAGQVIWMLGNNDTDCLTMQNLTVTYNYSLYPDIGNRIGAVTSSGVSAGTWYHIAMVRSGGTVTTYLNGTSVASFSYSPTVGNGGNLTIGSTTNNTSNFNGWIDELRFSKTARYTANFTPSTTPFQNDANTLLLMHMDGTDGSTVFVDDNGIAPYIP